MQAIHLQTQKTISIIRFVTTIHTNKLSNTSPDFFSHWDFQRNAFELWGFCWDRDKNIVKENVSCIDCRFLWIRHLAATAGWMDNGVTIDYERAVYTLDFYPLSEKRENLRCYSALIDFNFLRLIRGCWMALIKLLTCCTLGVGGRSLNPTRHIQ